MVIAKERPVELRLGFLHPEFGVLPLYDKVKKIYRHVAEFYRNSVLDKDGMRLKPKYGFRGPKKTGSRNKNSKGRSSRSRRRRK